MRLVNLTPDPVSLFDAGVLQIVPTMVFHLARRVDVVAPGPVLRDSNGRVCGYLGLTAHLAYR